MNAWWKIGIWLGYSIACILFGYHFGAQGVNIAWKDDELAQKDASIENQKQVIDKEHKDQLATQGVSDAYQKKVAALDATYDALLLQKPATSAPADLPRISTGEPGHNAAACNNGLPESGKRRLIALMKAADIQTARLMACQAWISSHSH